jgi:hypothetical protein
MDELLETVHRLVDRVERLEQRLAVLEGQSHPAVLPPSRTELPAKEELLGMELALPQPAGIFPVIGKAMLGIAGAYLLRAVSESGAIPQAVVVAIALVMQERGWCGRPEHGFPTVSLASPTQLQQP